MLQRLFIENYRSLRSVVIELDQLTVVTGVNGSGKSNLYQALDLIRAAAEGRFKRALLDQGGMPSALWAGPRGKGPVRMRFAVDRAPDWSTEESLQRRWSQPMASEN